MFHKDAMKRESVPRFYVTVCANFLDLMQTLGFPVVWSGGLADCASCATGETWVVCAWPIRLSTPLIAPTPLDITQFVKPGARLLLNLV
jgi:hypothetical protein